MLEGAPDEISAYGLRPSAPITSGQPQPSYLSTPTRGADHEKYDGAPFGLSIVNPAKAGPFDLQEGRPVVVRAKVEVNPLTAALTVATDPSGEHAIPQIIDGIPLQIKHVNVTINRPGFTFNPTNCEKMAITGTISSAEGASAPVSIPFQVTNCGSLAFKPGFTVSTQGKTSRANGASLVWCLAISCGLW